MAFRRLVGQRVESSLEFSEVSSSRDSPRHFYSFILHLTVEERGRTCNAESPRLFCICLDLRPRLTSSKTSHKSLRLEAKCVCTSDKILLVECAGTSEEAIMHRPEAALPASAQRRLRGPHSVLMNPFEWQVLKSQQDPAGLYIRFLDCG